MGVYLCSIRQTAGLKQEIILDGRIQEWNAGVLQGEAKATKFGVIIVEVFIFILF